jgi:hypothetical protein
MTGARSAVSISLALLTALVGGFLVADLCAAAQNPAPAAPAQKQTHAKKVWTEDDVVALRTSADVYQREQDRKADEERAAREAEAAARKAAAAQAQKPGQRAAAPAPVLSQPIPERLDDLRKRIEVVSKQVADLEDELRLADNALNAAREDQKEEVGVRRTTAVANLEKARAELQALQNRLRELQPSSS